MKTESISPTHPHKEGETMSAHLVDGEFQSDKYPTTPRGKVPLSVKDVTAQDLLWQYAQRRRSVDAEFSADLESALVAAGYKPMTSPDVAAVVAELRALINQKAAANAKGWAGEVQAIDRQIAKKVPTLLDSLDRQGNVVVAPPAPATLISIARRWVALVGGSWYLDRHAADKGQLITDTLAAIAEAEGLDAERGTGASPPSEPVPALLSHIEQGRSDRVAKLEEALLYSRQLISMVEKHGTPAGFSLDASSTLKMIDAALSTQGEKKE